MARAKTGRQKQDGGGDNSEWKENIFPLTFKYIPHMKHKDK